MQYGTFDTSPHSFFLYVCALTLFILFSSLAACIFERYIPIGNAAGLMCMHTHLHSVKLHFVHSSHDAASRNALKQIKKRINLDNDKNKKHTNNAYVSRKCGKMKHREKQRKPETHTKTMKIRNSIEQNARNPNFYSKSPFSFSPVFFSCHIFYFVFYLSIVCAFLPYLCSGACLSLPFCIVCTYRRAVFCLWFLFLSIFIYRMGT